MATQEQPIDHTPIDIVTALSLVIDQSYKITVGGSEPVVIGENAGSAPSAGHPLYPASARADHKEYIKPAAGLGIWIWSQRPTKVVVTEAE